MASPTITSIDKSILQFMQSKFEPLSRMALFIVFFWFGFLKVIHMSPANALVAALLAKTMPFVPFEIFVVGFGLFEMVIGVLFLIRGWERLAMAILAIHMITTFGPFVFLPSIVWQAPLVPTLEGQYIIKNLVVIALAIGIASHLDPISGPHATKKRR